jgi:Flp pilus assembly protein TadD
MLNKGLLSAHRIAVALLASTTIIATPVVAQQVVREAPESALARHIRVLAANPRDFNALIGAGHAALELADLQAAAGFFGRAEEANPNAPAAKAGLGAAMAHMGDADGAIFYFNQAARLGAQPMTMALERGLARDLAGDLGGAQADYRLAISSLGSDEARRRLALSLAIARNRNAALDALQPLLNRRDQAAQRTRAFVLALVGDQAGAAQAIEAVMPGGSARFAPFFRFLPNLSIGEKAAAVHLGIFPEDAEGRVAAAQQQAATQQVAAVAPPRPTPVATAPVKVASVSPNVANPTSALPSFSLPSASGATSTGITRAPGPQQSTASAAEPVKLVSNKPQEAAPAPSFSLSDVKPSTDESNLSGIDKLLATIAEAPPAPKQKVETTIAADRDGDVKAARASKSASDKKAAARRLADKKAAEEKKKREEKLAAEKKAREEAARLGVKGTNWIQLAGGSNKDRMAVEYKKLSSKAGSLLKSRTAYVTEGKEYFRLLVGPFDSKGDAQALVNKLAKEGVDGFSWTRTPAQIKIEKLPAK